jgi:hypothetical protein
MNQINGEFEFRGAPLDELHKLVNLASRFTNLVDPNLVEEKVFGEFFGEFKLINPNSVNPNPCQIDPHCDFLNLDNA